MSLLRDRYGHLRVEWFIIAAVMLALLAALAIGYAKHGDFLMGKCRDGVPKSHDGRCWENQKLVVEDGVVICRCREKP